MLRSINITAAMLAAAAVTFALFFLMQYLIAGSGEIPDREDRIRITDIIMPDENIEVQRTEPKPERPEELADIPELPDLEFNPQAPAGPGLNFSQVEIAMGDLQSTTVSSSNGEYLPIVTVPPQYPNRALQRGIEGWCLVAFTVNENGGVEGARVVDGEPQGIFDSASLRAVSRFRFNPRMENGTAVKTHDVQYVFTYQLDE